MNICADDYGLDPKINAAILNLIDLKKISSVSVLIRPCSSADIKALKAFSGVRIGLHLDIFKKNPLRNYVKGVLSPLSLSSEINAQIRLFKFKFGFFPHYIDGHMHCQLYPFVREALVETLANSSVPRDFYVRSCNIPSSIQTGSLSNKIYLSMLGYFNKGLLHKLRAHEIKTNSHLYGAFNNHLNIEKIFESYKLKGKSNDLFFFHPSTENIQHDNSQDSIARKHEYEYLAKI